MKSMAVGFGFLFCFLIISVFGQFDQTRQPGAVGSSVVEAVIDLIRESCLFADDKRFLRRLAYVQSHDGTDAKTYSRGNYHGGIWQVDEYYFRQTKNSAALYSQYNIIRNQFGINWNSVQWRDLRKPLYSGIAAALYTQLHGGVGWRIENQANVYQNYFESSAGYNFTKEASILELGCHGNILDLVFVVDSSNSLSSDDFLRAKYFMSSVVDSFDIATDKTRVAVITYANNPRTQFYLNTHTTKSSLKNAIDNIPFVSGSTNTADAITQANQIFSPIYGGRSHAVKVLIVITDGVSDDRINTMHAADGAQGDGIVVFSVGVGSSVNSAELSTIATNPDCTHVFTVSGYDEIKALKEEIQKSACRAPIYINSTYSCVIEKCPPLAVLTGTTGVTIETNMTCGLGNVYTAFTNPYPSESFYEVLTSTSKNNPGVVYRNSSIDQTLYINLVDALKETGSPSTGCVITITPYKGDHTDHNMKCYIDSIQIPCPDNCKEKWNFPNPCTPENLANGTTKFPHPTDKTKYLMCDNRGKLYIVQCPQYESYYQSCQQCVGNESSCLIDKNPIPTTVGNPCTLAHLQAGLFFFIYPLDVTKFIHCDVWGKAWVLDCPIGEEWDQAQLTCVRTGLISNPCKNLGSTGPFFYEYPCDPTKYIRCDGHDQMFVRDCTLHYVYNPAVQLCVPRNSYTPRNPAPGTVCPDGTIIGSSGVTNAVTHAPSHGGGDDVHGYICCSACSRFTAPCTHNNIGKGVLLHPIAGDRHHYIQCDLTGHMYCPMSCNPEADGTLDYFNARTQTCVDGSLSGVVG